MIWFFLFACTTLCPEVAELDGEAKVLAIGDSILGTHAGSCQSIPDQVSLNLGSPVDNRSVPGSSLIRDKGSIISTYEPGGWSWVVVDGGANDVVRLCETPEEDDLIDTLSAVDGQTGAMPELVDQIVEDGAQVVLMGYYPMQDGARYGFDNCASALVEINTRYAAVAQDRPGVTFVDLSEVIDPVDTPDAYLPDRVHPSTSGAALGGALIAEAIEAQGGL